MLRVLLLMLKLHACRDMQPILCHLEVQQGDQPLKLAEPEPAAETGDAGNGPMAAKPSAPPAVRPRCSPGHCQSLEAL